MPITIGNSDVENKPSKKEKRCFFHMAEYRKWTEEELDALRPPEGKTGFKWPVLFLLAQNGFGVNTVVGSNYNTTLRTDILKIPLVAQSAAAPVGSIAGVFWAFIQPLVVQNVTWPWGKGRGWLVIAPVIYWLGNTILNGPLGIGWLPHLILLTSLAMIVGWIGTLADMNLAITGVSVAGKNQALQTSFSINKGRGGYFNSIVFGLFNTAVVNLSTKLLGYNNFVRGSFFIFGLYCFVMMSLVFARAAKPFDPPIPKEERIARREARKAAAAASGQKTGILASIGNSFKLIFTSSPLLILCLAEIFRYIYLMGPFAFAFYYWRYHVGNLPGMSLMSTCTGIANVIGTFVLTLILKITKNSKKTAYIIAGYVPFVVMLICFMTNLKNTTWGFIGCKCFANLFGVGGNALITANFNDCATYVEWKTGQNVRSLILGCYPIPLMFMGLIQGVMNPLLLKSANYSEEAIQAEFAAGDKTMSTKIAFFYMIIPCIFGLIASTIIMFYPGTKKFDKWRSEVEARNAAKEAVEA